MPARPLVFLAAPPHAPADDLRGLLADAGFAVEIHPVGTGDRLDFGSASAIVLVVGSVLAPAAAQTRLWKAEMRDDAVPVLWVLPFESQELTIAGLNAGADAVLSRPLDPAVLAAHVRALARARAVTRGLADRAADTRELNEQLRAAHGRIDATIDLTRRVRRTLLPTQLPQIPSVRFAIHHVGGAIFDVTGLDEHHVAFWLADPSSAAGELLGFAVKHGIVGKEFERTGVRLLAPDEVLRRVNRTLIGLDLDPPPLVSCAYGLLNVQTGRVEVSRGGLPPPVYLPANDPAESWAGPGAFLGSFDAEFPAREGTLQPGDRLILATHPGAVTTAGLHRARTGTAFAEAVAGELRAVGCDPDELTVLVVEFGG
jgi:hypothetical protein